MGRPGYLSVYVAYVDGQPACAGWISFHANGRFADLWGGATVAEHREMGLYTAVLAKRTEEAVACGYRFLTTDASPMSRPILAKHGVPDDFKYLAVIESGLTNAVSPAGAHHVVPATPAGNRPWPRCVP